MKPVNKSRSDADCCSDHHWERQYFNQLREKIEAQEAELKQNAIILSLKDQQMQQMNRQHFAQYHELMAERAQHAAAQQVLEQIQRQQAQMTNYCSDQSAVLQALSALGQSITQMQLKQDVLLQHQQSAESFTDLLWHDQPYDFLAGEDSSPSVHNASTPSVHGPRSPSAHDASSPVVLDPHSPSVHDPPSPFDYESMSLGPKEDST